MNAWERIDIKAEFAALINARPSEIAFIPNTTTGENFVLNGLGLPASGGNVVTDALHFEGALIHLGALKRDGLDVRIVLPRDWRIQLEDLDRVIDNKTKLVELSLVAMFTGFQHDLKAVCDLAHSRGALVYADIAQAAGCTPIDVKASGVDFCACSSFKWLMGDFGLGFLYVHG
jgi:selenocysteine lyase/cysteine desulfurase